MNPDGHIYMDDEDKIPTEDKTRLDGYLRGRAEADLEEMRAERVAELERRLAEVEGK